VQRRIARSADAWCTASFGVKLTHDTGGERLRVLKFVEFSGCWREHRGGAFCVARNAVASMHDAAIAARAEDECDEIDESRGWCTDASGAGARRGCGRGHQLLYVDALYGLCGLLRGVRRRAHIYTCLCCRRGVVGGAVADLDVPIAPDTIMVGVIYLLNNKESVEVCADNQLRAE
jgi:hypothetical protein